MDMEIEVGSSLQKRSVDCTYDWNEWREWRTNGVVSLGNIKRRRGTGPEICSQDSTQVLGLVSRAQSSNSVEATGAIECLRVLWDSGSSVTRHRIYRVVFYDGKVVQCIMWRLTQPLVTPELVIASLKLMESFIDNGHAELKLRSLAEEIIIPTLKSLRSGIQARCDKEITRHCTQLLNTLKPGWWKTVIW